MIGPAATHYIYDISSTKSASSKWIFAAHQVGAAVAASGAGIIYKIFNSYTWAFALRGMFYLVSKWYNRCNYFLMVHFLFCFSDRR
ncbi:hypothetical protein ACFFH4_08645 [Halalkalibacter alkalisediminis]|uniref:Uncharacterized protein n=1 Tax=Halalkalibacter alkalisediminis TaxID=935616 RepID=A0ABV6NG45_9BACI